MSKARHALRGVFGGALRAGRGKAPQMRWSSTSTTSSSQSQASSGSKSGSVLPTAIGLGLFGFAAGYYVNGQSPSKERKISVPKYASIKEMEKALEEIKAATYEDVISTEDDVLLAHGFSEWSSGNIDTLPIAVAYPKTTEEVSQIAKICNKYRIPIIGYGAGSSIEGNFAAPHGGISVDFSFMDQIVSIHEDDLDVVVQPNVNWMDLNKKLESTGLFFPMDPSPTAKIGGMVSTNCSGTNAARYGTMKDWVLNMTVVLADGTVIKTRKRPRKSAAGYNLNGIFVGSEGTLGLITEVTLKLTVVPKEQSVAVVAFPTIRDAAATASAVMRAGIPIAAMELLDDIILGVMNKTGSSTSRKWAEQPTLFFKFSGSKASVADNIKEVQRISNEHKGGKFEFAKDKAAQDELWSGRKVALWSFLSTKPEGTELYSTDIAVPYSRVAELIEISKKEMTETGLYSMILGHLGDGNFHEAIMYNKSDPAQVAIVHKAVKDMTDRALEMEGTCTGEHSIGLFRKDALLQELGPETINAMKSIKQSLDPNWIMNPGKIFDTPT